MPNKQRQHVQRLICNLLCAIVVVCGGAGAESLWAATQVRIAGWGGTDKEVMHSLVSDVLADDLRRAGINVTYQPVESNYSQFIVNSLSSGTAPDLFYVDVSMIDVFTNSGLLAPVDGLVERAAFLPALSEAFTRDGRLYAAPKDFNTLVVIYNDDVFVDAGVPVPTPLETFASLRAKLGAVVAALGDEGVFGVCLGPDFSRFAPFLFATGWQPIEASGRTLIDARFERAFRDYVGMFEDGTAVLTASLGHSWSGGCFGAERTAIAIEGNWISSYLRDKAPNLRFGAVPPPSNGPGGGRGNLLFTVGWGLNAAGDQRQAASEVLALLTSPRAQEWVLQSGLALPSRAAFAADDTETWEGPGGDAQLVDMVYRSVDATYVRPFSFAPYGQAWVEPINEGLSAVLNGGVDIATALRRVQERYDYLYQQHQGTLQ